MNLSDKFLDSGWLTLGRQRRSLCFESFHAIQYGGENDQWQWILPKGPSGVILDDNLTAPLARTTCPLCNEYYDSDEHRPVQIKGNALCSKHIFGKCCIEEHLQSNNHCPICLKYLHQEWMEPRPKVHYAFQALDVETIRWEWQKACSLLTHCNNLDCIWFTEDGKPVGMGNSKSGNVAVIPENIPDSVVGEGKTPAFMAGFHRDARVL